MAEQHFADEGDDWAEFEAAPAVNSTVIANNDLPSATDTDPWAQFEEPKLVADGEVNVSLDSKSQQNLLDAHDDWAEFEAAPIVADSIAVDKREPPQEQADTDPWAKIEETLHVPPQSLVDSDQSDIITDEKAPLNDIAHNSGFHAPPEVAADNLFIPDISVDVEINTKRDAVDNDTFKVAEELVESKEEEKQESIAEFISAVETVIPSRDTDPIPAAQIELDPFADCDVISSDPLPVESATANFEIEETITKDIDVHSATADIQLKKVESVHVSTENADDPFATLELNQDSAMSDQNNAQITHIVDNNADLSAETEGNKSSEGNEVLVDIIEQSELPSSVGETFADLTPQPVESSETVPAVSVEMQNGDSALPSNHVQTPDNQVVLNATLLNCSDSLHKGAIKSEDLVTDLETPVLADTSNSLFAEKNQGFGEVPREIVENELSTSTGVAEVDGFQNNITVISENEHLQSISISDKNEFVKKMDVSSTETESTNFEATPNQDALQIEAATDKEDEQEFAGHIPTVQSETSVFVETQNDAPSAIIGGSTVPQEKEIDTKEVDNMNKVDANENFPTEIEETVETVEGEHVHVHSSDDKLPSSELLNEKTDASSESDDVVKDVAGCVETVAFSERTDDVKEEDFGTEITSHDENKFAGDDSLSNDPSEKDKNDKKDEVWDEFESTDISHPTTMATTVLAAETKTETAAIAIGDDKDDWAGFAGPTTSVVKEVTTENTTDVTESVVPEETNKTETKVEEKKEEKEEDEDDWAGFEGPATSTVKEVTTENTTDVMDNVIPEETNKTETKEEEKEEEKEEDEDDWAGFEGPATSVAIEVTTENTTDVTDNVVPEESNKTETKVEEKEEKEDDWDGFEAAPNKETIVESQVATAVSDMSAFSTIANTGLETEAETEIAAVGDDGEKEEEEDDWAGFAGPTTSVVKEVTTENTTDVTDNIVPKETNKTDTKVEETEEDEDDWAGFEGPGTSTVKEVTTENTTDVMDNVIPEETNKTETKVEEKEEDEDDWAGFEGPATSVAIEVTTENTTDVTESVVPEESNKTETKVEEKEEEEDDWDGFEAAPSHSHTGVSAVSEQSPTTTTTPSSTLDASTSVYVPVVSSSVPVKSQEDLTQNEQTLLSLLQQLRSSTTENASNPESVSGVLLSTVSHWQHFASLLQPSGDKATTVCDDTSSLPVLTVPVSLRSETPFGSVETHPRHTQTDLVACVASSRATVSQLFAQQQQQQRQQDMDILDAKSLDAQLERLHLLPHQLHLASHFAPTPVASSSTSTSTSFSFTAATAASVQPVSNKVLVRCGSGWQRKIARLSAVSMSVSHDTHDTHDHSFQGREAMLLNKQVSLTLQQASSAASNNRPSDLEQSRNDQFVADKTADIQDAEDDWGGFVDSSPVPAPHSDTVDGAANESETALSSSARAVLRQLPDLSFVLAT